MRHSQLGSTVIDPPDDMNAAALLVCAALALACPSAATGVTIKCTRDEHCVAPSVCVESVCKDPCDGKVCGPNTLCSEFRGSPTCYCAKNYTGDPDSAKGCVLHPCVACVGPTMWCESSWEDMVGTCKCRANYVGNPATECLERTGKKFKLFTKRATWQDALESCKRENMTLATYEKEENYEQIAKLIREESKEDPYLSWMWLGGSTQRQEAFDWTSIGKRMTFTRWSPGQPFGDYHCVGVDDTSYRMYALNCSIPFKYICEYE